MRTIYILETSAGDFTAYKTIEEAKMALLQYYVNSCLTDDFMSAPDNYEWIKDDLEKIVKYGYVEDCAWIHDCDMKE